MRRILFTILTILLLIATIYLIIKGVEKIDVKGFTGIDEKDKMIERKIKELSNEITTNYPSAISDLKKSAITLSESKAEYETQAALSKANSSSYISQLESYDIDYLWTKFGNYAKDENVVIKIDVTANESSSNLFNLEFTVTGDYVNVTDFIYDIENDSKLGFKIDNFKMVGVPTENKMNLAGTFTCKDIPIKIGKIDTTNTNRTQNNTDEKTSSSTPTKIQKSTKNLGTRKYKENSVTAEADYRTSNESVMQAFNKIISKITENIDKDGNYKATSDMKTLVEIVETDLKEEKWTVTTKDNMILIKCEDDEINDDGLIKYEITITDTAVNLNLDTE